MNPFGSFTALIALFFCAIVSAENNAPMSPQPDVEKILSQMTLDEKAVMCRGNSPWDFGGVPRLGIPPVVVTDGPHGVRFKGPSYFPTGTALAATWNRELAGKFGEALGAESRFQRLRRATRAGRQYSPDAIVRAQF